MKLDRLKYDHLINNLERVSLDDSIYKYKYGRKAFLSIGKGNHSEWLETLLPNTRLIIEPKIIGTTIGLQYINGQLNKAINENSMNITERAKSIRSVPKIIPIKNRIEILGILYIKKNKINESKKVEFIDSRKDSTDLKGLKFCAFQIFHCQLNHFQSLQELKNLKFEIPENEFTNFISDIEIYRQCWKEGKLFQSYPTSGIVLKVNSRKFQKYLGKNNIYIHWAYAIN